MKKEGSFGAMAFRLWVSEFYMRNAGFFIVCALLVLFFADQGAIRYLIGIAVENPLVLLAGCFLPALLYALKTIVFGRQLLASSENVFFRNLLLYPARRKWFLLIQLHAGQLLPLFLLANLLLGAAFTRHHFVTAFLVLVFFLSLLLAGPILWMRDLRIPQDSGFSGGGKRYFPCQTNWTGWLFRQLLVKEPAMLFLTKGLSVAFLYGGLFAGRMLGYDGRFILLLFLASAYLHLGIIESLGKLENSLPGGKNLPFSQAERHLFQLKQVLPLLLPELVVLLSSELEKPDLIYRGLLCLWYPVLLLLLHQLMSYLINRPPLREKILPVTFFAFSFAIMYKWHPLVLLCTNGILVWLFHRLFYYKTDFHVKED